MEAHNPEGSYQRNAGFSLKAKGSSPRAEAGWGGLWPPTLRDATMSPIQVQPGWVGSGPLTARLRDAAIPQSHSMETPLSGGARDPDLRVQGHRWRSNQLLARGYALSRRNPDHLKYTGFKNVTTYGST